MAQSPSFLIALGIRVSASLLLTGLRDAQDRSCLWIPNIQPKAGPMDKNCVLSLMVSTSASQPRVLLTNRKAETSFLTLLGQKISQRPGESLHPVV